MDTGFLEPIIRDAVKAFGGKATPVQVARFIWSNYEPELRASGDFFYQWQVEMHNAAHSMREQGVLKPQDEAERVWELN